MPKVRWPRPEHSSASAGTGQAQRRQGDAPRVRQRPAWPCPRTPRPQDACPAATVDAVSTTPGPLCCWRRGVRPGPDGSGSVPCVPSARGGMGPQGRRLFGFGFPLVSIRPENSLDNEAVFFPPSHGPGAQRWEGARSEAAGQGRRMVRDQSAAGHTCLGACALCGGGCLAGCSLGGLAELASHRSCAMTHPGLVPVHNTQREKTTCFMKCEQEERVTALIVPLPPTSSAQQ